MNSAEKPSNGANSTRKNTVAKSPANNFLELVGFKMQRANSRLIERNRPKSVKYSLDR